MVHFECRCCNTVMGVEQEDLNTEVICPTCDEIIQIPPTRMATGFVLGEFVLKRKIATWECGKIFSAWQKSLKRKVAVKMLDPAYVTNPEVLNSFLREARKDAKLNFPRIGQIFTLGEQDGLYYYVMENLEICNDTNTAVFMKQIVIEQPPADSFHQQFISESENSDEFYIEDTQAPVQEYEEYVEEPQAYVEEEQVYEEYVEAEAPTAVPEPVQEEQPAPQQPSVPHMREQYPTIRPASSAPQKKAFKTKSNKSTKTNLGLKKPGGTKSTATKLNVSLKTHSKLKNKKFRI